MNRMLGTILSTTVAVAVLIDGYLVLFKGNRPTETATPTTTPSATSSHQTSAATKTASQLKDGTYTGNSASTQWGDVQVQMTVAGGKMTKITVLKYPDTNGHSKSVNATALPTYKSEALKAQNAKIQHISGATETYKGFTTSLQNALNQA